MLKRLDDETQADLDLLRDARDTLQRRGWIRSAFSWGPKSGVCLLGSVMADRGLSFPEKNQRVERLTHLLDFAYPSQASMWNDSQTDVAPVLARIDAAISERLLAP